MIIFTGAIAGRDFPAPILTSLAQVFSSKVSTCGFLPAKQINHDNKLCSLFCLSENRYDSKPLILSDNHLVLV